MPAERDRHAFCRDIARFLEDIGGAINTSTGNNSLSVGCQILAEDLDSGLELMADVVMNPSFPEDAFLREKESFVADAEEDLEDPLSVGVPAGTEGGLRPCFLREFPVRHAGEPFFTDSAGREGTV